MVNSKKKGNRFELKIAKYLSKQTGVKWARVPTSGATFTSQGMPQYRGDITCSDTTYDDYVIECKHYRAAVTLQDLVSPKSKLWNWVNQLIKESEGKIGLLFFRGNYGKDFLIVVNKDSTRMINLADRVLSTFSLMPITLSFCIPKITRSIDIYAFK